MSGDVDDLVAAARAGGAQHAEQWAPRLAAVRTWGELVDVGEALHAQGRTTDDTAVLAGFLTRAQHDPQVAAATGEGLGHWANLLEPVLARLLEDSVLSEVLDPAPVAALLADAFVGVQLASATHDAEEVAARFSLLRDLAALAESIGDLGPAATTVLRLAVRSAPRRPVPGR